MPERTEARRARYQRGLAITCVCKNCGREFRPKARDRTQYCKRECAFAAMRVPGNAQVARMVERRRLVSIERSALIRFRSMRYCARCGATFCPQGTHIHCSVACSEGADADRRALLRSTRRTDSCRHCKARIDHRTRGTKRRSFCSTQCSRAWWSANAGRYRDSERAAESTRRAQKRAAPSERFRDAEVFARDRWLCGICGEPTDRNERVPHPKAPTIDHIIALANGGHHTRANTQCAHFSCNTRKGAGVT